MADMRASGAYVQGSDETFETIYDTMGTQKGQTGKYMRLVWNKLDALLKASQSFPQYCSLAKVVFSPDSTLASCRLCLTCNSKKPFSALG